MSDKSQTGFQGLTTAGRSWPQEHPSRLHACSSARVPVGRLLPGPHHRLPRPRPQGLAHFSPQAVNPRSPVASLTCVHAGLPGCVAGLLTPCIPSLTSLTPASSSVNGSSNTGVATPLPVAVLFQDNTMCKVARPGARGRAALPPSSSPRWARPPGAPQHPQSALPDLRLGLPLTAPNERLERNNDKPLTVVYYSSLRPFPILHHNYSSIKTWEADRGGTINPIL